MRFTRQGDVEIKLVVPFEFKHLVLDLSNAFGVPLSFDVQIWNPYAEYIDMTDDTTDNEEDCDDEVV